MRWIFIFFSVVQTCHLFAQVVRTNVIEHFTNTRCSICASRNPGFYGVLNNYPKVLHIAYHPSSPYSNCFFSQQNVSENDGRTNHYGIYGATPRFVLNGKVLPSANPAINTTTIDTTLNQLTPFAISVSDEWITADSAVVTVLIKTTVSAGVSAAKLYVAVAEEPINYNAPNGENIHHDVFRKALNGNEGNLIPLPLVNDSMSFIFHYKAAAGWNLSNLRTIAILSKTDTKEVWNAASSKATVTSLADGFVAGSNLQIFPNPFSGLVTITNAAGKQLKLYSSLGELVLSETATSNRYELNTTNLSNGIYLLCSDGQCQKLLKK
ncbi:MAG: Omp28-related outer membrane protein [Chitinophagales bacterium]|nr:Omp28-related outer membrane protein [Chitinophagales bacterium]